MSRAIFLATSLGLCLAIAAFVLIHILSPAFDFPLLLTAVTLSFLLTLLFIHPFKPVSL